VVWSDDDDDDDDDDDGWEQESRHFKSGASSSFQLFFPPSCWHDKAHLPTTPFLGDDPNPTALPTNPVLCLPGPLMHGWRMHHRIVPKAEP
jgi:hypothetical protein